jgi:hypothetical protein
MADYRDLAIALGGGYGQDTGPITPDTLATLRNGKKASASDLLGMLKAIGSGSLSNLESLVRGGVAQVPGAGGDLEGLARMGINKAFGAGGVNVSPTPVLPTTTDILGMMPRKTAVRPESAGMEELGGYMAPAFGKIAKPAVTSYAKLAGQEINAGLTGQPTRSLLGTITPKPKNIVEYDPRFDPRAKEQARLQALTLQVNPKSTVTPPTISLVDLEGRPFITSMSDRTAAGGQLTGINNIPLNAPVDYLGGQDYMFNNPGKVWASAEQPVKQILNNAEIIKDVTGQNPLYIPWRMAPTGGDFAHMTGETMLGYADTVMGKGAKNKVNREIKKLIPDWAGLGTPQGIAQYRNASDTTRKALKNMMDVQFRDMGGLNIGEARLAVTDPKQYTAQEGGIQNIGEIFAGKPMAMQSGHVSYPRGVPGQGLGVAAEDRNIFELLPEVVKQRGIVDPKNPSPQDLRALQMKPYAGVINADLLKALGY